MLLTETNIQSEAYSHNQFRYDVTFYAARPSSAGGYHGGVGLVTRERPEGGESNSCAYKVRRW